MAEQKNQFEKMLESALLARIEGLHSAASDPIAFAESSSDVRNLQQLLADKDFQTLRDTSEWNQHKNMLVDISGNMTPDLVLRCARDGDNRIIIEVKCHSGLNYDKHDSQLVRYFLHLLATTHQRKDNPAAIRRALILAAPASWFLTPANRDRWTYFINTYRDLARHFDITLAAILLPEPEGISAQ